ncbi:MAG: DUF559 domain-containing protein [Candidatus Taylorbacteria bacterium]|nr:DUF559 domain-containing protein [Candidatus Taylorbacteria bacterium]
MKIYYNNNLKHRSRELRNSMTDTEAILWQYLRKKRMQGYAFNRQKPARNFILDFYCPRLMLAIEIDGPIHKYHFEEDMFRQKELEELGIHFLRFSDVIIKNDINNVLKEIEKYINSKQPSL